MLKPKRPKRAEEEPSFLGREQQEKITGQENKEATEIKPQTEQEKKEEKSFSEDKKTEGPKKTPSSPSYTAPQDSMTVEIRQIMSQDLQDIYAGMDPAVQKKFKEEGRKVAGQIKEILSSGKIQAKKIFKLIFDWLKIIPGMNKFFLKQEAKIKTDRIINLNKK